MSSDMGKVAGSIWSSFVEQQKDEAERRPIAGAREWTEDHAAGGPCDWPGCDCGACEERDVPRYLSPRPAGGEVEEAAAAPALAPAKTAWSEWKMVSNTEQPKREAYASSSQDTTWFTTVKEWRTTQIGNMLVFETRLFSTNIIRQMIPRSKVSGMIAKRAWLGRLHTIHLNSFGPHPALKFKFLDSDNALEFQMDLFTVLYG
jgi:hypothetical protein